MFSSLSDEDGLKLAHNSRIHNYRKGQTLFMYGDKITNFYIVCRGTIQIFRETPNGHEITTDMLIAGDTVNSEEIVTKQVMHSMNARAVDDIAILQIPIAWMKTNFNSFDHMAEGLIAGLSIRLHNAQMEAEHKSTMSSAQIVACYLQRLCVLYNFDPLGFELPYSKTLIASRLRMELETFSRTLSKLKDQGIIIKGNHVSFNKIVEAGRFACDACSMSEDCEAHIYLHPKIQKTLKYLSNPNLN